jgi:hypothetical protein
MGFEIGSPNVSVLSLVSSDKYHQLSWWYLSRGAGKWVALILNWVMGILKRRKLVWTMSN